MNLPKIQKRATALMNDEFISIKTHSGYFNFLDDPETEEHLLPRNAGKEEIGRALLDALLRSRILNPKENWAFFSFERAGERYEEWVKKKMELCGYKTRRAMFVDMKRCSVTCRDELIIIGPTNHVKLEAWGRSKSDGIEDVIIPAASSAFKIGAALQEAFNRCS